MHAIVVNNLRLNDDNFFSSSSTDFYFYMRECRGLSDKQFTFYRRREYLRKKSLYQTLRNALKKHAGETIVLYYSGHGYRDGWHLMRHIFVPYKKLFRIFGKHRRPFIFINDCCFAMAAEKYQKMLRSRNLILGLAPENGIGYASVLRQILRDWSRRQPANPKYWVADARNRPIKSLILRRGNKIDYLCYPRKQPVR